MIKKESLGIKQLKNKLKKEVDALNNDCVEIKDLTPSSLMLMIKYDNGHIHSVFPEAPIVSEFITELKDNHGLIVEKTEKPKQVLPKKIIFHNRQAIGDILMLTAGIRDFAKAFPDIDIKVESTAMHMWDHNPNICRDKWDVDLLDPKLDKPSDAELPIKTKALAEIAAKENKALKVYIGPGKATNASNRSDNHFANAYRISIQYMLGIEFPQGSIRPDIYMTQKEYDAPPLIKHPYWLITAGEKGDWTAKTYPFTYWQEFVSNNKNMTFVQLGSKAHRHPKLKGDNIINLIGEYICPLCNSTGSMDIFSIDIKLKTIVCKKCNNSFNKNLALQLISEYEKNKENNKEIFNSLVVTEDRNIGIRNLFNLFLNCEGSIGLVSFQMHLAAAFNRPCITKNSLIVTDSGLNVPVNLIDKKFNALVDGKPYGSNTGFFKTGIKDILQLTLQSKRQLKVTPNHKIMVNNEWKSAKDIAIGDEIKIHNHRGFAHTVDHTCKDYARGYLLGNFLSDGTINKKSIRVSWFHTNKEYYLEDGFTLLDQAGWPVHKRQYKAKNKGVGAYIHSPFLYDFAKEKGCISDANKKTMSSLTMIGSWSYFAGLIAGYFDGDGTVTKTPSSNNTYSASIASVDLDRLQLLQIGLNAFGVYSKIYSAAKPRICKFAKKEYIGRVMHRLCISESSLNIFSDIIPIRNIKKKQRLYNIKKIRTRAPNTTRFTDKVISINAIGKDTVYDCEVSEVHAFDANSLYVHNCITVAGGREPVWFTRYPGQQYLATDGCLPCTVTNKDAPTACWICNAEARCKYIENINGQDVPLCASIIKWQDIQRAYDHYYEGGRLDKTKRSFKSKLVNISLEESSNIVPAVQSKPVVKNTKYDIPFGGGSLTDRDWDFLSRTIESYDVKSVLEFGAGLSTLLLNDIPSLDVLTYETNQGWIDKIKAINPKCNIKKWDGKKMSSKGIKRFDLCFVDGPAGGQNRELSTEIASIQSDLVIVHDAGREWERKWQDKYLKHNFALTQKGGHRCHFWKKISSTKKPRNITPVNFSNDKPTVNFVFNGRGEGGAERSTTWLMNYLADTLQYNVRYFSPTRASGTFRNSGSSKIQVFENNIDLSDNPCDLLVLYTNDWVWEFKTDAVSHVFENAKAKRKVMIVNYRIGDIGKVEWTKHFDKYIFLNSSLEEILLERHPTANTAVLPPPTDVTEFIKTKIDYSGDLRAVRHSSQGDTKYPTNLNEKLLTLLNQDDKLSVRLMPAPTFLNNEVFNTKKVIAHKRNQPPVNEFLKLGNVFWYHLPDGYTDQGPKTIIEALASGLPVIADNHSGAKDRVIHGKTGFLCDTFEDHIEAFKLLQDEALRKKMGMAAKRFAKKAFVPEKWIDEIVKINIDMYQKLREL